MRASTAIYDARLIAGPQSLDDGQTVHVWPTQMEAPNDIIEQFEQILTHDEIERAARFRLGHLRRSFVVARGVLRGLLGHYLDVPPSSVRLQYGPHGKPDVAVPARIRFNLSHSDNLTVFAFTADCDIGIDAERIRVIADMQNISERFLGAEETARLMSLPIDEREREFFRCWTRKEACLKAIGEGLSERDDELRTTQAPNESETFFRLKRKRDSTEQWSSHDLSLTTDYAATLVYRGTPREVCIAPLIDAGYLNVLLPRPLNPYCAPQSGSKNEMPE